MRPIEALYTVIMRGLFGELPRKPGAIIQATPKELREVLEKLTSDDARNTRIDY